MTKLHQPEAEVFARIIWQATMAAWNLCLGGGADYPAKRERRERMENPRPGDMVVEATAGIRQLDCSQAVGWLVRVAREPIEFDEWDEDADGPVPDEKVVYITTIDGRYDVRWTNCQFFGVPTFDGWWDSERWQKVMQERAASAIPTRSAETAKTGSVSDG